MRKRSVKKRIFFSNTLMVIVTLVIFLAVNILIIKGYTDSLENRWDESGWEEDEPGERHGRNRREEWELERDEFILLFCADGIICIASLLIVSQIFTRNLTRHIMEPLDELTDGVRRIEENNLTQPVEYTGEREFEDVCHAFNEMQASILAEQEKNRKYEKARTDMIAGISHDLRTPLTAIRGTIKGLMDGVASTPEQREKFLNAAYRRTGDMDVLLSQLLYLSRMETGNMRFSMENVEISDFLRSYAETKEEITLRTDGISAQVKIDPVQFQRILDNLLENSRKYAQADPLLVSIELDRISPGRIRICFHDNGVGVPEEKLPHIFEEFYRGDESRNKKEGNGLGLYIVKYLMEAMGGSARAENEDGFSVYLELPVSGEEAADGGQ